MNTFMCNTHAAMVPIDAFLNISLFGGCEPRNFLQPMRRGICRVLSTITMSRRLPVWSVSWSRPEKEAAPVSGRGGKMGTKSLPLRYGLLRQDRENLQDVVHELQSRVSAYLRTLVLYATSKDGKTWQKPKLGLFDFEGSTANNIVMGSLGFGDLYSPSVVKDDKATGSVPTL